LQKAGDGPTTITISRFCASSTTIRTTRVGLDVDVDMLATCLPLVVIISATLSQAQVTGCEKAMTSICGDEWKTNATYCLSCVDSNIAKLEPNCTLAKAEGKCRNPPAPPAPGPGPGPSPGPSPGPTGCHRQVVLNCGDKWANLTQCLACVDEKFKQHKLPNCTIVQADKICRNPPTPAPPLPTSPPTPPPAPTTPHTGAPPPHIILIFSD
jgi:hypothetical protein